MNITDTETQPRRSVSITKLILAAVAALSIFASPVFAGPMDGQAPSYYNGYQGDFQLQGR